MPPSTVERTERRGTAAWLIALSGVWCIGLGLYFIFVRPALLPEDVRYIAIEPLALQVAAPNLADWLTKVFTVMGGFMAGTGVLVAYVGWTVLPLRPRGAAPVLILTGLLTLVLMSAINFALHSDFRWLLVLPPVVWFAGVVLHLAAIGEPAAHAGGKLRPHERSPSGRGR
jgi:hypothetical protein